MDKINARALTETATIKAKVKSTIALVKKKDQGHIRTIESLKSEIQSLNRDMVVVRRHRLCNYSSSGNVG